MVDEMSHAERVRQLLKENRKALYIGRVRPETKARFTQVAEEQFDNDYGMFLDFLFNFWLANAKYEELLERIEAIELRLTTQPEPPKVRKSVCGKPIERGVLNE